MKLVKEFVPYIIILVVVVLLRTFVVTPILVQGESMEDILYNGEVLLLKKYDRNYNRFDIVVISSSVEGDSLVKRVIGWPGESIRYKNNRLYIDGEIVEDPYDNGTTSNFQEILLGDDEYFVLGDNREVSLDSRMLGWFDISKIIGTTKFTIYPFNRLGSKN